MKKKRIGSSLAAWIALGLLISFPAYAKEAVIPKGVTAGEVSLEGMSRREAGEALERYVKELEQQPVVLEIEGAELKSTVGELGLSWENPEAAEEAASHIPEGNLIRRYMEQTDIENQPVHIPLEFSVDPTVIEGLAKEQGIDLAGGPQNASITRVDGAFQITPGKAGVVLDAEATALAVAESLEAGCGPVRVTAKTQVQEPEIDAEDLASIEDVLGTFTTDFSSSGTARSKNIENGAGKINGHVLMPGETLSGYACMNPFTTENGYYTAAAYENGQVVDSVGGGVCQIATTLYNAALQAEVEITQRQNHSMIVSYVEPSKDAAIAGTYKDIKITNNYSTPIYVEGYTKGKTLTFTIYGKETRPENRKVAYISETLGTTDPGAPQERIDLSLAPGTKKRVQSAHVGRKSRLWKVVTVDGVETERTLLHTDTYIASKAVYLVGPPLPAVLPTVPETEAVQNVPEQPTEGAPVGPGETAPVQPQAEPAQPQAEPAQPQAEPAQPQAEPVQPQEPGV